MMKRNKYILLYSDLTYFQGLLRERFMRLFVNISLASIEMIFYFIQTFNFWTKKRKIDKYIRFHSHNLFMKKAEEEARGEEISMFHENVNFYCRSKSFASSSLNKKMNNTLKETAIID